MITPAQMRAELAAADAAKQDAKEVALEAHIDHQLRLNFKGIGYHFEIDLPVKTRVALIHRVIKKYVEAGWLWHPTIGDGVYVRSIQLRCPNTDTAPVSASPVYVPPEVITETTLRGMCAASLATADGSSGAWMAAGERVLARAVLSYLDSR